MAILPLLGLIVAIIKLGIDVAKWLHEHPDATAALKEAASRAVFTMGEVHRELSEWEKNHDPEAP